ncbi:hypothetical protein FSP39_012049 [Pinctada imbricata]|uniref:Uncharacterized protein n=1 Tax=Pinctada imbricata TaxID=66713 RepID=A0AA89BPE2_PINIB|nr:hypothetical protein FSP39_012049 [Pinctada imbricata]
MSWPQRLVESRVTNVHIKAAQIPNPGLKGKKKEEYDKRTKEELERAIQQIPPRTKIHDLCDHRSATPLHYAASNGNLALCEVIIAGMGKDQLFSVDASRKNASSLCSLQE